MTPFRLSITFSLPCVIQLLLCQAVSAQWSTSGANVYRATGNVGIGTNAPAYTLDVRSAGARAISALATGASGTRDAVYAVSKSSSGRGIVGYADKSSGTTYGVYGRSNSTSGRGVHGYVSSTSGTNIAIYGLTNSPTGFAGYFAGGRNYFQNNVGIGLTGPSAKLEILSSGSPSALALQVKNSATRILTAFGNGAVLMGPVDSIAGAWVGGDATGGIPAAIIGHQSGITAVPRIRMTSNKLAVLDGVVGIGVTDPIFQLHLSANSAAKPASGSWTIASDARLKKNVKPIQHSLDQLLQLRGVTYQWINPETQGGMHGTYTGMIAQNVEKVFPEWISTDADGFKHLTIIGFEGLAVEALRELRQEKDTQIDRLRDENSQLQAAIGELTTKFNDLEKRLEKIEPTED